MYGGRTVEVLNTDAEGRLVLADTLVRAGQDKPDAIVDVATLTAAIKLALGHRIFGVMSNDDAFREQVVEAAGRAGEQAWPMPLPAELRRSLSSPVADIANTGERMGGGLVAGLFLKEFVPEGTPWAHLDIAGPAFHEGAPPWLHPQGRHRVRGTDAGAAGGGRRSRHAGPVPARLRGRRAAPGRRGHGRRYRRTAHAMNPAVTVRLGRRA
jgi:leucyl aminopeptidase